MNQLQISSLGALYTYMKDVLPTQSAETQYPLLL